MPTPIPSVNGTKIKAQRGQAICESSEATQTEVAELDLEDRSTLAASKKHRKSLIQDGCPRVLGAAVRTLRGTLAFHTGTPGFVSQPWSLSSFLLLHVLGGSRRRLNDGSRPPQGDLG